MDHRLIHKKTVYDIYYVDEQNGDKEVVDRSVQALIDCGSCYLQ